MYGTPRFRAINRQYTTPIKSSPLVVPSSVASESNVEEPRRAAPSHAATRSLPVKALKIMASVEKYTPAPEDSEPEQEDPDYETESSATRDTTTESEQQAAEEQAKAYKGRVRERRRTESAGGPGISHQRSSVGLGPKKGEKTTAEYVSPIYQQRTSEAVKPTFEMVKIPRGPKAWCDRNPPGCSLQTPPRVGTQTTASPSFPKAQHGTLTLTGANSIELGKRESAAAKRDRLSRPSDKRISPPSSSIQIASPPPSSPPLGHLDCGVDLERFRTAREMTACIHTAKSWIRTLEAQNSQLLRQQQQTTNGPEVRTTMNEVRDVKEELLREFRDEVQRLMRGPMRQRDLSWQTAEERDHVLQLSDANVEPIGGRGSERPHRAIKEATVGLQILDSRKEDYGYDSHKLGTYTAPLLESEDSAHLPLQSMDPNIQQSPVVDRKQRKKKKKGKFNSCTESVDTGKGKKLALTPEKHVEEQHVEERKRKRKKSKKEGKRTKRLAKCPAGSIISIGSGNDSSPIGALPSSPVRELEVKDSPEKAARREAKRRRRAEVEEGSIELGMPARKKREKTRELTMSPQPGTEEDEAGRGRRRSKSLNRKSVSANEISDTPEKVAGSGAKRKMHPDTELEGSPCGGRQSKRSKRKDKAILTSSFEAQSPSPSPKARHTKDLSKVKAVVPSSSRADEAAGVAAAHDPLINQDVVMLEGRKLAGKAKKAKKKTQTAEEKDYNAHRAVAQAQERERAEKTKNASFAAPQPTAAPSSSKAGATTKPAPKSSPQIEAVVVPKPPRPPQPSQPQAPPPQPRHPKASLTAHIPTRPSLPAPIPQPVYDRNTLAARLAHDRATQPAAPAHYRSDIHPAGGLPAAMRRARCTNTNTAFPIVADCTCGGSVPTFFSPHQETPDIDKWPGSRDEFWRWVKMIAECKGHDPLAKGRCEVLYWVVGPGKGQMAAQSGSQKMRSSLTAHAMVSAIDRSCRAISTISVNGFYGPASERARPKAVIDDNVDWDSDEVGWRAPPRWEALVDYEYDRNVAPYLEGLLD